MTLTFIPVDRQARIQKLIKEKGIVKVTELSKIFGVTELTIRRDFDVLEKKRVLERTHGGAVLRRRAKEESHYAEKNLKYNSQKEKMKDMNTEFNLKTVDENKWELTEVYSNKFSHPKKVRQPGEPLFSTFNFTNPTENEKVNFIITAVKCEINSIMMEFDNYKTVKLPITLKKNETLKYEGGDKAIIYSSNWEKISTIDIDESEMKLKKGEHSVTFDCEFKGDEDAKAKIEIRLFGTSDKLIIEH